MKIFTIIFALFMSSSAYGSIASYSSLDEAIHILAWLNQQNYDDGISKEEAKIVGAMYLDQHAQEYRFLSGGTGEPEDSGDYWYLPKLMGIAGTRTEHGISIHKVSGECSHPKLKKDSAIILLQSEIRLVNEFIANQTSVVDAKDAQRN